jgi:hypothetical protein
MLTLHGTPFRSTIEQGELKMRTFLSAAATAALALTTTANAGLIDGMPVTINGAAGPQFGGTTWGVWSGIAGQGPHILGGFSQYSDSSFPTFYVTVSSYTIAPPPGFFTAAIFTINFASFSPQDFTTHDVSLLNLASGGAVTQVTASQGSVSTDGNDVQWQGTGAGLAANPVLTIGVYQVPAPAAVVLFGAAGVLSRRRRN